MVIAGDDVVDLGGVPGAARKTDLAEVAVAIEDRGTDVAVPAGREAGAACGVLPGHATPFMIILTRR